MPFVIKCYSIWVKKRRCSHFKRNTMFFYVFVCIPIEDFTICKRITTHDFSTIIHPFRQLFKPVVLMPSTRYFWKERKIIKIGIIDSADIAKMAPQSVTPVGSAKFFSAIATV